MIQYNLVNVPIEKSYYVNGVLKLSNKTYYSNKFYNNIMLPMKKLRSSIFNMI
ncbi:hypothetical protein JZU68_01500 [bacterium]|nr:hypothetical protein [bacterium]